MKKLARKNIIRSLALACFAGTTSCCSLLFGQQLAPRQQNEEEKLPPIVSSQAIGEGLPPIVSATTINEPSSNSALPPIVPSSSMDRKDSAESLAPVVPYRATPGQPMPQPPAVSVDELMAQDLAPVVNATSSQPQVPSMPSSSVQPTPNSMPAPPMTAMPEMTQLQKGKNFPSDGERRIAEFVQANSSVDYDIMPQIANTAYGMPPQQNSPSDVIVNPVPVPTIAPSPMVDPMQMTPSIGGQATVNGQGQSVMVQPTPGSSNFFEGNAIAGAAGGPNVTADVVVEYGPQAATFDCCGFICSSRYYAVFDMLYFRRNDGVFRASNIPVLSDYDSSWGGRITLGKKRDCTRGIEATYMHFDPWIATSTLSEPTGSLVGAVFPLATGDLPNDAYSAFRDGTYAQQWHKSRLISFEVNRTWWGSDVAKAFWGGRYIHFQDDFRLSMANLFGEQGFHSIQARNQMFGVHCGMEVLYDIGYRLSFSYGAKVGGYVNAARNVIQHINDGALRGFNGIERTDWSWSAEFGIWSRYKLSPNIRFRAGYELFSLFNIYESESMYSPSFGSVMPRINQRDSAVWHGPSIGFEVYR